MRPIERPPNAVLSHFHKKRETHMYTHIVRKLRKIPGLSQS